MRDLVQWWSRLKRLSCTSAQTCYILTGGWPPFCCNKDVYELFAGSESGVNRGSGFMKKVCSGEMKLQWSHFSLPADRGTGRHDAPCSL